MCQEIELTSGGHKIEKFESTKTLEIKTKNLFVMLKF